MLFIALMYCIVLYCIVLYAVKDIMMIYNNIELIMSIII